MPSSALTRADVETCVAAARAEILGLGVRRLALFGSVQRNAARPDSDVDILVEFEPGAKTFERFLDLGDLLETAFDRSVELVTTESLSPYLGPHILAEAEDVLHGA